MNPLSAKTQVVVVTFNPKIELLTRNLLSLNKQFKNILVVDNSSKCISEIERLCQKNNYELRKLEDNFGIAYAQNVGLKKALARKLEWLLTMDQDSVIPENLSREYQKVIDKFNNIGLIGWSQSQRKKSSAHVREDWFILSSGCLLNTDALNKCGGFDNKLFIDHVDTDVNIKIRNLGYKTLTTDTVKLVHELGTKSKIYKTVRGNPYIAHSPIRIYYNVRNGVVLTKRYFIKQPKWIAIVLLNNVREGVYMLLYQPNRARNFFLLLRAWFEGITNRLGKFKD